MIVIMIVKNTNYGSHKIPYHSYTKVSTRYEQLMVVSDVATRRRAGESQLRDHVLGSRRRGGSYEVILKHKSWPTCTFRLTLDIDLWHLQECLDYGLSLLDAGQPQQAPGVGCVVAMLLVFSQHLQQ